MAVNEFIKNNEKESLARSNKKSGCLPVKVSQGHNEK